MRLKTYLHLNKLSVAAFAERIGMSPSVVCRYSNGRIIPRPGVMQRIYDVTGGQVTFADFYDPDALKPDAA